MKRLMFLIFLLSCLSFLNIGCSEPDPIVPDDTEINGGNNDDGGSEDNGNVNPTPPDEFIEEPNDPSADPQSAYGLDYSKLASAGHPRLLIDDEGFKSLKKKVTTDKRLNKTLYKLHTQILKRAEKIVTENRQFAVPNDHYLIVDNLVYCSYAYKMTGQSGYLTKAKADLLKTCRFGAWNPSGLSIGEISLAVALAYDWLYYDLSLDERKLVHKAMVDKGIRPMYNRSYAATIGNWNSICLGGVACASLAVYEKDKDIAVKQIEKAIKENLVGVKGIYSPDGNYAEGCGYWEYGTAWEVCFLSCLEDIFGQTAGIKETPGFMQSGKYAIYSHGTMNSQFSYNDGGGSADSPFITSWWFAAKNDDPSLIYAEKRMLDNGVYSDVPLEKEGFRLLPAMLCMIEDYDFESKTIAPPTDDIWQGDGEMPIVIVRKGWNFDESDVYLGIKAGHCNTWKTSATAHSHMDIGSFVFEAEGVRWSDDIQRPGYTAWFDALSKAGSRSGDTSQSGLRWDTFRVSNLCHSTIVSSTNDGSVAGKLHSTDYYVDGNALIDKVIDSDGRQGALVNMTEPMKGQVARAYRTVELVNGNELVVTDEITALSSMDCKLEWRIFSVSSSSVTDSEVVLTKNGKKRTLTVSSSNPSVTTQYTTWPANKPTGDGWGVLNFAQGISDRTIAGWTATIPAGMTVKFVTILKK
ncbi:MAG: heparinase II/III family protein [Bacteroidales bacterium]|nr:heparinase II/III family protein [Bacteroidales bacterium]